MNSIDFRIKPSLESNDHQVRILVDKDDFLGEEYLGIDPHIFFDQKSLLENGRLFIGRCTCGCEGCNDYTVMVQMSSDMVYWKNDNGFLLQFEYADYTNKIKLASTDFSWENANRRTERIVSELFKGKNTKDNYSFDWASARIKEKTITLSFSKDGEQKLYEIIWDGNCAESALTSANQLVSVLFREKTE